MTTYDTIAQDEDAHRTDPLEPRVVIYLEGGVIQDIHFPADIVVEVHSYDMASVDGVDAAQLRTDARGDPYVLTVWGGDA